MPVPHHAAQSVTGSLHLDASVPNQDCWQAHRSPPFSLFAVLDGHGPSGEHIASAAAEHLVHTTAKRLNATPVSTPADAHARHERALRAAFAAAAEHVDSHPAAAESGTTATLLIHDAASATLSLANVGDSTAVAARRGRPPRPLSALHRPGNDAEETRRVTCAGAAIRDGYVCHDVLPKMISVTRALGDLDVRSLGIIPTPNVAHFDARDFDFIIVATDGLWDAHGGLSQAHAVNTVYRCLDAGGAPADAVGDLLQLAKGRCSSPFDDTTIMLVCLSPSTLPRASEATAQP